MGKLIAGLFLFMLLSTLQSFSQTNEFNRPQITIIVEHQKNLGKEAEDFSIFMSLPKINCPYLTIAGTNYAWIPNDWGIDRDFFRYKDEYDENKYTQLPYFNKVDYNSINSQLFPHSLDEASKRPADYLTDYSAQIFDYIFAKSNNTFSLDRVIKRSLYNARDAAFRLSENVQRGDAIIKDDLEKIFQNVFVVGLKVIVAPCCKLILPLPPMFNTGNLAVPLGRVTN